MKLFPLDPQPRRGRLLMLAFAALALPIFLPSQMWGALSGIPSTDDLRGLANGQGQFLSYRVIPGSFEDTLESSGAKYAELTPAPGVRLFVTSVAGNDHAHRSQMVFFNGDTWEYAAENSGALSAFMFGAGLDSTILDFRNGFKWEIPWPAPVEATDQGLSLLVAGNAPFMQDVQFSFHNFSPVVTSAIPSFIAAVPEPSGSLLFATLTGLVAIAARRAGARNRRGRGALQG